MEHKNSSILFTVLGVATLFAALVGATFAYFSATASSASQNVDTGKLAITASLGTASNTNIIPTTWSNTLSDNTSNPNIAKFTFTVDTTGTDVNGAVYDISLTGAATLLASVDNGVAAADQGGDKSQIIWRLYNGSTEVADGNFNSIANPIKTGIAINGAQTDNYTLYVYILENGQNQDKLQGATVSATMTADAYTPKVSGS